MSVSNLENIPACLRVIARQIEDGELQADVGVLTLRNTAKVDHPSVFGFGKSENLEPFTELEMAANEIRRLAHGEDDLGD